MGNRNFCKDSPIRAKIKATNVRRYGSESWVSSEEGRKIASRVVKESWVRVKNNIDLIEPYSLEDTVSILLKDNYWTTIQGQGCNRTLYKSNPKLYKSIYEYSAVLEQKMKESGRYASAYNFSHRVRFIAEYGADIERLCCKCGKRYSWTGYCRACSPGSAAELTKEQRTSRALKSSATMRCRLGEEMLKEGKSPRYDVESIAVLNTFAQKHGLNLQHAEQGGEVYIKSLGYWLDGYDRERNVVVEIDEPSHFCKELSLLPRDIKRHQQICKELHCVMYHIYFNKRTGRVVLYNSPDQPNNWNINNGIDLAEFTGFAKNGTKQYGKYTI